MTEQLMRGDALLIVDPQNDFCPGGALGVAEGDAIMPVLNEWIAAARQSGVPIYVSRDWHPVGHISFIERGGPWPPHCVQKTPGAAFHPDLDLPPDAEIVTKGDLLDADAYSAFSGTDLPARLRANGVHRLWVGGLATDYCVRATVLDGLREGFDVRVIVPAVRAVNVTPGDDARALTEMRSAGAELVDQAPR